MRLTVAMAVVAACLTGCGPSPEEQALLSQAGPLTGRWSMAVWAVREGRPNPLVYSSTMVIGQTDNRLEGLLDVEGRQVGLMGQAEENGFVFFNVDDDECFASYAGAVRLQTDDSGCGRYGGMDCHGFVGAVFNIARNGAALERLFPDLVCVSLIDGAP